MVVSFPLFPQALLCRLEAWQLARGIHMQSCQQQLRQLQPARSTATAGRAGPKPVGAGRAGAGGSASSGSDKASAAPKAAAAAAAVQDSRYPARLVLSSWMMVHYPRVVFSKNKQVS